jgi:uncharacterized protein
MPVIIENKTVTEILADNHIHVDNSGRLVGDSKKNESLMKIGISNHNLQLILMPTEKCNFRCTYCYEDFAMGTMKPEVIAGIKSLLRERCSDLKFLNVEWFGGEPLVAKTVVIEISKYVKSLTYLYPYLHYVGSMTTNAYLLNFETFSTLVNLGVRNYQISLDGPEEIHNKSRLRADGGETFETIWSNLLAIRNSSLPAKILLRIHVAANTFEFFDSLIEDLKREFLPDPRFTFVFRPLEHLGGVNNDNIPVLDEKKREDTIKSLQTKLFGEKFGTKQNVTESENYVCYASKPNSLIIRANGDVSKCTVALYDERNKIANLQPDGTIKLISGRLAPWVRGLEFLDFEALGCPLTNLP